MYSAQPCAACTAAPTKRPSGAFPAPCGDTTQQHSAALSTLSAARVL